MPMQQFTFREYSEFFSINFSKRSIKSRKITHQKGKISSKISTDATFSQARVDQLCAFAQIEDVSVCWKLAKIVATDSKPAGFSDLEILYPKRETIKVSHVISSSIYIRDFRVKVPIFILFLFLFLRMFSTVNYSPPLPKLAKSPSKGSKLSATSINAISWSKSFSMAALAT